MAKKGYRLGRVESRERTVTRCCEEGSAINGGFKHVIIAKEYKIDPANWWWVGIVLVCTH